MTDESIDISYFSKQGEYLEDMFTLNDFLNEPTTRKILIDDSVKDFQHNISPKIIELHNLVKNIVSENSRLFHRDNRNMAVQEIIFAIFNNVKKKYNLDIFYNDPILAVSLLEKKK